MLLARLRKIKLFKLDCLLNPVQKSILQSGLVNPVIPHVNQNFSQINNVIFYLFYTFKLCIFA